MARFEIIYDRQRKKYLVKSPIILTKSFDSWSDTYEFAFQTAQKHAPSTIVYYKSDGTVKHYEVKPYPVGRFSKK